MKGAFRAAQYECSRQDRPSGSRDDEGYCRLYGGQDEFTEKEAAWGRLEGGRGGGREGGQGEWQSVCSISQTFLLSI